MELRGEIRKQRWLNAVWTLAQGCGAVKQGKVVLVEEKLEVPQLAVLGDEPRVIQDFCEAVYEIASSVDAQTCFFNKSNDWIKRAMDCQFDISDPDLLSRLEASLTTQKFLSAQDEPSAADFVIYASLKSWVAQTPPETKANFPKLIPWYGTISKSLAGAKKEKEKSPKEKIPERPLDDICRLDLVVGKVLSASPHPDADALYCEEIDLGEGEPRKIASGLRKFVKIEDLEGAMVIVLANMKVKSLRGFPSHGMVMCASNDEHTAVELMRPPSDAKIGDRVSFEGFEGHGPPDQVLSNKKNQDPLPILMPNLKTDANRTGFWKTHKMVVNGKPCVCDQLANAHIS